MTKSAAAALLAALFPFLASVPTAGATEAQFAKGRQLYGEFCSRCHGADGKRGEGFQTPIWGPQTQIGRFENGLALFEYHELMMPFDDPAKLDEEQKFAVVKFLLVNHGAMPRNVTLDRKNAASIAIR